MERYSRQIFFFNGRHRQKEYHESWCESPRNFCATAWFIASDKGNSDNKILSSRKTAEKTSKRASPAGSLQHFSFAANTCLSSVSSCAEAIKTFVSRYAAKHPARSRPIGEIASSRKKNATNSEKSPEARGPPMTAGMERTLRSGDFCGDFCVTNDDWRVLRTGGSVMASSRKTYSLLDVECVEASLSQMLWEANEGVRVVVSGTGDSRTALCDPIRLKTEQSRVVDRGQTRLFAAGKLLDRRSQWCN